MPPSKARSARNPSPRGAWARTLYGVLMGASDMIPGYSGGTTLGLLGFYDPLVANCRGCFRAVPPARKRDHLLWVLPFLAAWAVVFVIVNYAMREIDKAGFGDVLVLLFAAFAATCAPMFAAVNRPQLIGRRNAGNAAAFALAGLVLVAVSAIIFALKLSVRQEPFGPTGGGVAAVFAQNPGSAALFCAAALFAGFFMIIPGVSGAMMLYLFNQYWTLNQVVTGAFAFRNADFGFLVLFVVLALIGAIGGVLLSAWAVKRNRPLFYGAAFGMVCASPITVLLVTPPATWDPLAAGDGLHVGLAVLAVVAACALNGALFWVRARRKRRAQAAIGAEPSA